MEGYFGVMLDGDGFSALVVGVEDEAAFVEAFE